MDDEKRIESEMERMEQGYRERLEGIEKRERERERERTRKKIKERDI